MIEFFDAIITQSENQERNQALLAVGASWRFENFTGSAKI